MRKPVIAIDFDDVLMNFNQGFLAFHNQFHGTNLQYEDIVSYNMKLVYQCDSQIMVERVKTFYQSPHHTTAKPIPGAVDAVEKLSQNYILDIITSRPETTRECTHAWIREYFPSKFRDIHFANHFAADKGAAQRSKLSICKNVGAAVFVDDALEHNEEIAQHGIPALMPDRPWNRSHTPAGVTRVYNWDEIVDWVNTNLK